jgi:hypothetical protein
VDGKPAAPEAWCAGGLRLAITPTGSRAALAQRSNRNLDLPGWKRPPDKRVATKKASSILECFNEMVNPAAQCTSSRTPLNNPFGPKVLHMSSVHSVTHVSGSDNDLIGSPIGTRTFPQWLTTETPFLAGESELGRTEEIPLLNLAEAVAGKRAPRTGQTGRMG